MIPAYPHRMSSSEIERALYISNDPYHALFFEREEPGVLETEGKSLREVANNFIQAKAEIGLEQSISRAHEINNKKLIEEIVKLNQELGYTIDRFEIVSILEKVPERE